MATPATETTAGSYAFYLGFCLRRLRVLCECGSRPCGSGGRNGGDQKYREMRVTCRLLVAVKEEEILASKNGLHKAAVDCQRVGTLSTSRALVGHLASGVCR